jgi:hypothetical protein
MNYRAGDYVFPTDLPRRFVCRVDQAESTLVPDGSTQVLRLVPLTGPWPQGTVLIRLCEAVMPVPQRELAQMMPPVRSSGRGTHRHAA